jgi:hypothetical protein
MFKRHSGIRLTLLGPSLLLALGVTATSTVTALPAQAAGAVFTCSPDIVVAANIRVVSHCATAYNDAGSLIHWFAYPTSDSANASRILSVFETARATNGTSEQAAGQQNRHRDRDTPRAAGPPTHDGTSAAAESRPLAGALSSVG